MVAALTGMHLDVGVRAEGSQSQDSKQMEHFLLLLSTLPHFHPLSLAVSHIGQINTIRLLKLVAQCQPTITIKNYDPN